MRNTARVVGRAVLVVSFTLIGCPAPDAKQQPATQPAEVDRQAEEQRIRQISQQALEAAQRGDVDAVAGMYAEDAIIAVPFEPQIRDREALRESLAQFMALPELEIHWEPDRIEVSEAGDMAYETGRARQSFLMQGERVELESAYTLVYRRIDGEWRGVAESITPTSPPPGTPEEAEAAEAR